VGSHTFAVTATDYTGNVGNTASWTWTVVSPTLNVSIKDTGFTPKTAASTLGRMITWKVTSGVQTHQVVDTSGMGLFSSPPLSIGQSYSFTFVGGGAYKYADSLHPTLIGTVNVPVGTFPVAGSVTTTFTITWASAAPDPSFVFDVQIKRPGATWATWKFNQTALSSTFVPDAGVGTYSFRARYHNTVNNKASGWSQAIAITIS
jgi:plastocyanin